MDKVLRGANPTGMPMAQPIQFDIVSKLKMAKALGITIPQWLLLRADEVMQ